MFLRPFFLLLPVLIFGAVVAFLYGVIGWPDTASGPRVVIPETNASLGNKQVLRILILGTSLTSRGSWPEEVEARLGACAAIPVVVTRLARAGATSSWGLLALNDYFNHVGSKKPDVLIVEFSGNDASLYHGFPLYVSQKNHVNILDLARSKGVDVFLATMSPAWGMNALERPGQSRYHALYRTLAAQEHVGLIDTAPTWADLPLAERSAFVPDGLHPSEGGMRAIAVTAFVEALKPFACAASEALSDG